MRKKDKSCSTSCPFMTACWAGFLAALVMLLTIALSGVNYTKSLGVMFLGYGSSTLTLYIVGFLIHLLCCLFFAFIYVFYISKIMTCVAPWIKGFVYGLLITIGAHLTMPYVDQLALMTRGVEPTSRKTCCTKDGACGKKDSMEGQQTASWTSCKSCCSKDKYMWDKKCTRPMKHPIQASLGHHVVYGLVLAAIVAHGCCRKED